MIFLSVRFADRLAIISYSFIISLRKLFVKPFTRITKSDASLLYIKDKISDFFESEITYYIA